MTQRVTDVLVIGTGPGGEGAAMQLNKSGKKVTVVERYHRIGGGCTHWGTIPSKALRFAISQLTDALSNQLFSDAGLRPTPTLAELRRSAQSVISKQESLRRGFYERNEVEIIKGQARLADANTVVVDNEITIRAEQIVLSPGSRPFRPPSVDFDHPRIFDSDTILDLAVKPHSITVYGAGVIGCEYASMFRNLGIKVNLVNTRSKLLEFLDDEIIDALSYRLRESGVLIRHNETFERIEALDDGVVLCLQSGKQLKTDILLWAAGRIGNTEDLGLETVGLEPNRRGYLATNNTYQTEVETIYAVGDVVGFPSLASAAYTQGRIAAMHILGDSMEDHSLGDIPTGIYTSPEISSVGKTERELTEAKVPYEVGQSHFRSLARAQITGKGVGMLKILFHRDTLQLLGIHCFGPNAAEIIHIGHAIMAQKGEANTLKYFMNATFNYPTMAEAYRVAALNGYNRLF